MTTSVLNKKIEKENKISREIEMSQTISTDYEVAVYT